MFNKNINFEMLLMSVLILKKKNLRRVVTMNLKNNSTSLQ